MSVRRFPPWAVWSIVTLILFPFGKCRQIDPPNTPQDGYSASSSFHALQHQHHIHQALENYPYSDIVNEYFPHSHNSPISSTSFTTRPRWKSLGPEHIGGRTLCLYIHPKDTNELWMGSAGSGLWYSNTGGLGENAWNNIRLNFPVQSVASIAADPSNSSIMYIGTGENYSMENPGSGTLIRTLRSSRGIGLLKTTDKGKHWELLLDYSNRPDLCIWKIIVHPHKPQVIYLAGNMGILKTNDGGNHWQQQMDACLALDLMMDPADPETLYAGIGGYGSATYGLFKTLDGGLHWDRIPCPVGDKLQGRIVLGVSPSNPKKVVAAFSDAFASLGILWTNDRFVNNRYYVPIKDVCAHQGWYAKGLLLKSNDPSKLLMGGVDLYYDSTGTGNKFLNLIYQKTKIHADFHDIICNPLAPEKVYFATDGGVYRSEEFGKNTFSCNGGYLSTQFYNGSIDSKNDRMLGGLQDNKTAYYANGAWQLMHLGDGTYNYFHPTQDSILFVSSQFQNLYKTNDLGKNWNQLIPTQSNAAFVSPFAVSPTDPNVIYSGGKELWSSVDGGQQWSRYSFESSSGFITSIVCSPLQKDILLFSSYDPSTLRTKVWMANSYGQRIQTDPFEFKGQFIRQLVYVPSVDGTFYAALSSYGIPGFAFSTDYGATWRFPANHFLPPVPCHTVLADPQKPETVYAGTDLGLYVSFDRGEHWEAYNEHDFDLIAVYDLKYHAKKDRIIAYTHGHGCFEIERIEKSIPTQNDHTGRDCFYHFVHQGKKIMSICLERPETLRAFNLQGQQFPLTRFDDYIELKVDYTGILFLSDASNRKAIRIILL